VLVRVGSEAGFLGGEAEVEGGGASAGAISRAGWLDRSEELDRGLPALQLLRTAEFAAAAQLRKFK